MASLHYYANKARSKADKYMTSEGQILTVTRKHEMDVADTVQAFYCLPQPLSATAINKMVQEGRLNVGDAMPHNFIFKGDADVAAGDYVSFGGQSYIILSATPQTLSGVVVILEAVGAREAGA